MRDEFERWACSEGLISESHGVRFVNSMCDVARKAWEASRAAALEEAAQTALSKLKDLTTEMEGYSYFGSNPGVKEDDYDDVADAIRSLAKGESE